jgi:hypothetical protein
MPSPPTLDVAFAAQPDPAVLSGLPPMVYAGLSAAPTL